MSTGVVPSWLYPCVHVVQWKGSPSRVTLPSPESDLLISAACLYVASSSMHGIVPAVDELPSVGPLPLELELELGMQVVSGGAVGGGALVRGEGGERAW